MGFVVCGSRGWQRLALVHIGIRVVEERVVAPNQVFTLVGRFCARIIMGVLWMRAQLALTPTTEMVATRNVESEVTLFALNEQGEREALVSLSLAVERVSEQASRCMRMPWLCKRVA